jgi:hypothetical protein
MAFVSYFWQVYLSSTAAAASASSSETHLTDTELTVFFSVLDADKVPLRTLFICIAPLVQYCVCHSSFVSIAKFIIILVCNCEPSCIFSLVVAPYLQSGYIVADELKAFFDTRRINISDAEVQQMIRDADLDGNNKVSLDEFKALARQGAVQDLPTGTLWSSLREVCMPLPRCFSPPLISSLLLFPFS